jgi:AraC-like DNA-binding protein
MAGGITIRGDNISAGMLAEYAQLTNPAFELLPRHSPTEAVLHGDHRMLCLRCGMSVHTSDTTALEDLTTIANQLPGMSLMMFLSGNVDARIDGIDLGIGRREGEPVRAVMISRARADRLERKVNKGERVRHVVVTVTPEWINDCAFDNEAVRQAITDFRSAHVARFEWIASPVLVAIAEQMLHPPEVGENLYLESRALDLLADGFSTLATDRLKCTNQRLAPADMRRLQVIEETIAANSTLPVEQIAKRSGVSLSTMQRLFRAGHGITVKEYVRARNLLLARRMLEREGASVTQAAFAAGYGDPTNFSTAFKREFGLSPRTVRR